VSSEKKYEGIYNDLYGGMTQTGSIIKDAWLFKLLPEEETCEGWTVGQMQVLYEQVYVAWEPYGHLVSRLPDDLKQRHQQIHDAAIKRARELGWDPDLSNES
jgi:hypothetical protein